MRDIFKDVHEPIIDRNVFERVYYRFVGYIEKPELPKHRHNVKADPSQGVTVEYVPQIA